MRSGVAAGADTRAVLEEIDARVGDVAPDFVFAFYGQDHDDQAISDHLDRRFPGAARVGGTSCRGVMSERGLGGRSSIGLLLVEDPDGAYGAASVPLGDDPAAAAEAALMAALEAADSAGELPELIWIYQSPGREEAVVTGLRRVVGDRCPIVGGSSADDDVAGSWRQLGPDGPLTDGLVVGVLFSSGGIGFSFQGGYEPTGTTGIVTELGYTAGESGVVTGGSGRHILEIDGEHAADVYNRWIDGALPDGALADGGTILADTTMSPLAVSAGRVGQVTHFRLVHPESVSAARGLTTFANVDAGARVYGMRGDRERLVQRVGRVVSAAVTTLAGADVAGALIVYCGGCLLAVGDEAERVSATAARDLGGVPYLGCFTFGEQGMILDRNVHANLMISAICFAR
ncbi:MAG TPA: FIST N-terminal domain-containing protein [Solirubrobacter sp.]|nr:FIST N-terminal domain-containing protein [Solirubrobacter sp.]